MVRAVATLERWLWSKYSENRPIETIPPAKLDAYLAEFWQVLVRENGTDFLPVSFRKHRYCLDRFLVANDYPESITTSHAFPQSQNAYQLRVNQLMLQGPVQVEFQAGSLQRLSGGTTIATPAVAELSAEERLAQLRHIYPSTFPARLHPETIRARIPEAQSKVRQTITDMTKKVTTLERWLWSCHKETRQIETIPPEELDAYLAQFWCVLISESGKDYEAVTFRKFRYFIDRFLTESGYSSSIAYSQSFSRSQAVFQWRMRQLQEQQKSTGRKSTGSAS